MPRNGAYIVSELPEGQMMGLECDRCGRKGRYRKETILKMFGPDHPLPDVRVKLANCPRYGNMSDPCRVTFSDPIGARK